MAALPLSVMFVAASMSMICFVPQKDLRAAIVVQDGCTTHELPRLDVSDTEDSLTGACEVL